MPWFLCGLGTLFCLSGIYFFRKNVFEENRSVKWAIIIIVMGLIFIGWGTAMYAGLIN
jgi:hypothetical protein